MEDPSVSRYRFYNDVLYRVLHRCTTWCGGLALEREALYGDYLAHQIARLRRRAEGLRQSGSGEADGFAALADALEAKKGKWEHDNGT